MTPQLRRRFASVALILGFFLAWELLCLAFGVKDIILPRPSQIVLTLGQRMPAIWPHALQTLYTTLVGFALGIVAGVLLGAFVGSFPVTARSLSGSAGAGSYTFAVTSRNSCGSSVPTPSATVVVP